MGFKQQFRTPAAFDNSALGRERLFGMKRGTVVRIRSLEIPVLVGVRPGESMGASRYFWDREPPRNGPNAGLPAEVLWHAADIIILTPVDVSFGVPRGLNTCCPSPDLVPDIATA